MKRRRGKAPNNSRISASPNQQRALMPLPPKEFTTHILPIINNLLGNFSQYAPQGEMIDFQELKEMISSSPIIAIATEVRILLSLAAIGEYRNKDAKLQDFVRMNEQAVHGSFRTTIAKALTKYIVGYSFSEICRKPQDGLWVLDQITYADPEHYRFMGRNGEVDRIQYSSKFGYLEVPLQKGLHLVNQDFMNLSNSPYGLSAFRRIRPLWKGLQVFMASILVAAPKQAFPFLVGKVDTNQQVIRYDNTGAPMLDSDGNYLTEGAAFQLSRSMQEIQNQSALIVDSMTEIKEIAQHSDGKLLFTAINLFMKQILLSLMIPSVPLIQSEGSGSGDSNLAKVQSEFAADITASSIAEDLGCIVDQIHKPNIIDNFGLQDDYGYYTVNANFDPKREKILGLIGTLTQQGALTVESMEIQKQILSDLDLPSDGIVMKALAPAQDTLPSNMNDTLTGNDSVPANE